MQVNFFKIQLMMALSLGFWLCSDFRNLLGFGFMVDASRWFLDSSCLLGLKAYSLVMVVIW